MPDYYCNLPTSVTLHKLLSTRDLLTLSNEDVLVVLTDICSSRYRTLVLSGEKHQLLLADLSLIELLN